MQNSNVTAQKRYITHCYVTSYDLPDHHFGIMNDPAGALMDRSHHRMKFSPGEEK